ncbi:hypothetical protein SAMN04487944_10691 [Gracilibacillus ureilyticus]|uniref:Uncharacterized protein n=1 Tax=Gracilibacillus ureilyticus TaxID=531814 RepID=A0A1H9QAS6_9BACI|nr:hypothetical protein SAMN04487944_10691 [Gracilibacillus ureilyticus]
MQPFLSSFTERAFYIFLNLYDSVKKGANFIDSNKKFEKGI